SWAMLLVPALIGLGAPGGAPRPVVLAFLLLSVFGFLCRTPLLAVASGAPPRAALGWLAAYAALSAAALLPLLLAYQRWWLLAFGVPALGLLAWTVASGAGKQMSQANELLGVAGLSLGAPAAYYAATGRLDADAWLLGALSALYLSAPVLHVNAAMLGHRAAAHPAAAAPAAAAKRRSVAFHLATFLLVTVACAASALPWLAALPFFLALAKTARLAAAPPARVDFKRLGWREMCHASGFTAAVIAGWRLREPF
ncbi:MAG: YwiC-like family protein, partial [Elusimicrobia bacterium]|nr:YwiC-like family protein [Elusimicrobiota bacterium]